MERPTTCMERPTKCMERSRSVSLTMVCPLNALERCARCIVSTDTSKITKDATHANVLQMICPLNALNISAGCIVITDTSKMAKDVTHANVLHQWRLLMITTKCSQVASVHPRA